MQLLQQAFSVYILSVLRVHFHTKASSHTWVLSSQHDDMSQWLQIELRQVKKITGIVTQGAKALGTEMFVTSFSLQYSDDGKYWDNYSDDEEIPAKVGDMNHIAAISYSLLTGLYLMSPPLSLSTNLDFYGKYKQQRPCEELHVSPNFLSVYQNYSQILDGFHHHESRTAGL